MYQGKDVVTPGLAGQLSQGLRNQIGPEPIEPSMLARTRELIGYLSELESLQAETRRRISGPYPEACGANDAAKRTDEPCLEELLAIACNRAACVVGEQKSILSKI